MNETHDILFSWITTINLIIMLSSLLIFMLPNSVEIYHDNLNNKEPQKINSKLLFIGIILFILSFIGFFVILKTSQGFTFHLF